MNIKSFRPFLGAKDFDISRAFYQEMGFTEKVLQPGFSVFSQGSFHFYLQDAYVKDWVDNSQVFMEVDDLDGLWNKFTAYEVDKKFAGVRLSTIKQDSWGREFFLHDPSGILWHFGSFNA